jgi:hypothetical protein
MEANSNDGTWQLLLTLPDAVATPVPLLHDGYPSGLLVLHIHHFLCFLPDSRYPDTESIVQESIVT